MDIKVLQIKSEISLIEESTTKELFQGIEEHLGHSLKLVGLEDFAATGFRLVYVASGGSEDAFVQMYDRLKDQPVYILTSGKYNSLAASMEILSYLQQRGKTGEILYGDPKTIAGRIDALYRATEALQKLRGLRLGLVGESSDWLIASAPDTTAYRDKLGMELVKVSMDELVAEIEKAEYPENQWTEKLLAMGYDKDEVEKALHVYGAFRRLVDKYDLGAVSVRCFDLLSSVKTTGCLGLAILNAEGVWGGCEGDIPSLVSMCILGAVSGRPIFMCNPSQIDVEKGEMVLAHCTLPVDMPYEMSLTTHFESGIGVAIAGSIKEGPCTVFKTSGDLSRHVAMAGVIEENLRDPHLCRSQIKIKLPSYDYFVKNPIANHHLVCVGDYTLALDEFFNML